MAKILLADDSPHAQRMGMEILSQEGFEVLGITDGRQALESLTRFAPDLVLADVCLPDHSGYAICERIKTNPAMAHVRVVLLVSPLESFDRVEAERVGADAVLHKPFEPAIVIRTIGPLLTASTQKPLAARQGALEQAVEAALEREPVDREQVRAAVMLAMEAALPAFLEEVTERVVGALRQIRRTHAR